MQEERRKIIRYALDYDIQNINTYSGYKGDLIVKITTNDIHAAAEIRKYADDLAFKEIVIKENPNVEEYDIFCVTPDKAIYHLKSEEISDKIHAKHTSKNDVWGGSK